MHSRNRNLGNGYRSHPMMMGGVSTASRISPDRSMRGQGAYRSEYRSFNNGGYGRGQPRQFQRPPQQKHNDVFMEAGRLATEYLVSKGLMPSNVLTGKWSKDSFRNQVGGANSTQFPSEGRASALSRLGGSVSDGGPGRKRYQDDYDSLSSNDVRDRRKSVSFKDSSPDRSREFGRSASMSVRSRAGDKDVSPSCQDEQKIGNKDDTVSLNPSPELVPENDSRGTVESAAQKPNIQDDKGSKESSSSSEKDLSMLGDTEVLEKADDQDPHPEAGEIKDESDNKVPEQQDTKNATTVGVTEKLDNVSSESSYDLIKFCNFVKFPTRARSSLASRGSKNDVDSMAINVDTLQNEPPKESGSSVEDMAVNSLPSNNPSIVQSDNSEKPSKENELEVTPNNSLNNTTGSISEVDTSSSKELVINEKLPECEIIDANQRGEKRASDHELTKEENKKPRESLENLKSEECLLRSDSLERQLCLKDPGALVDGAVILPSDEKRLLDNTLFPKGDIESCMDYTEEKQLLPSSFKTCDLNLMEASDVNENQKNNSMLFFPPASRRRKQPIPVDIDLSMSNNSFVSNNFGEFSIPGKDIEVIDLEDEPEQEGMHLNNSNDRSENVFTCLDGYSNNTHNGTDISEVQDGYGLMISELLANDMHSSSVPTDMNSLHGDLGLHNGEGILGDDDPVYMSLGEIPMSKMVDPEKRDEAARKATLKNATSIPLPSVDAFRVAEAPVADSRSKKEKVVALARKRKESEAAKDSRSGKKTKSPTDGDEEIADGDGGHLVTETTRKHPGSSRHVGHSGGPALWLDQKFMADPNVAGWGKQMTESLADVIPLCNMSRDWPDAVRPAIGEGIIRRVAEIDDVSSEGGVTGGLRDLVADYGIATSVISTHMLSLVKAVAEAESSQRAVTERFDLELKAAKEAQAKAEAALIRLKDEAIRLRGECSGFRTRCEALEKTLAEADKRHAAELAAKAEAEKKSLAAARNDAIAEYKESDDFFDIVEAGFDQGIYHAIRCFWRGADTLSPSVEALEDMASWPLVPMFDPSLQVYHPEIPYSEADIAEFNEKQRKANLAEWNPPVNEVNLRALQQRLAASAGGEDIGGEQAGDGGDGEAAA